jgi:dynein heavy chain
LNKDETIFAENEGFIQRCKDLKEICEGQLQFARKGANCVMPVFGGRRGPEITQNLLELEEKFKISLQAIRNLDYKILDVKITKWHDDYGQVFKDQIKNIEIMYYNTTTLAFNSMSTVQDAVEMLESFDSIAKRPLIKEFVHKKSADKVYKIFTDEIKEVEELFERESKKLPPMPVSHPKTGGLAIWAYSLICRIDKAREALNSLYFIPTHPHAAEALEKHEKLRVSLDNFIANTQFSIWKQTIDAMDTKNIDEKLDNYILVRQDGKEELPGSISTNPLF